MLRPNSAISTSRSIALRGPAIVTVLGGWPECWRPSFIGTGSQERLATIAELRSVLGDSIEVDVVEAVNATMHEPGRAASSLGEVLRRAMELGDGEVEALCRLRIADVAYNAADLATLREQSMELDSLAGRGETWAVRTAFLPHVWIMSLTDRPADVVPYLDAHRVLGSSPEPIPKSSR